MTSFSHYLGHDPITVVRELLPPRYDSKIHAGMLVPKKCPRPSADQQWVLHPMFEKEFPLHCFL